MDDSSVGKKKDYKAFQRVLYNLDMALKTIVNGKPKKDGFESCVNSLLLSFRLLSRIQQLHWNLWRCITVHQWYASCSELYTHAYKLNRFFEPRGSNESQSKKVQGRTTVKAERLAEFVVQITTVQRNAQYFRNNVTLSDSNDTQMIDLLYYSEELRTTPEKIDAMMESKHVLSAAKLLENSLKQAMSKDMMQIGALDDIRRTLTAQKNVSQVHASMQTDLLNNTTDAL
jgi:exocyst complex component 4